MVPTLSSSSFPLPLHHALAVLCFYALCGGLSLPDLYAASVKRKLKKRSVIIIDEGKASDIRQGESICFYNREQEEVGCGTVRRVQSERSFVKVSPKVLRKVRRGFTASPAASSMGKSGSSGKTVGIRLLGGGMGFHPFAANFPEYEKSVAPYWLKSERNELLPFGSSAFVGIEIEVVPFYTTAGYRYNFITPSFEDGETGYKAHANRAAEECKPKATKTPVLNPCYLSIDANIASIGGWLQFLYPLPLSPDLTWSLGAGIDVDVSSIAFSIEQRTDNTPNEAHVLLKDVTSSLVSVGGRLIPAHLALALSDTVNVFLTGVAVFGFYGTSSIDDYNSNDPNLRHSENQDQDKDKYVTTYFKEALDHKPGIGLMFHAGIGVAF